MVHSSAARDDAARPQEQVPPAQAGSPFNLETVRRVESTLLHEVSTWDKRERAALAVLLSRACPSPTDQLALLPASSVLGPDEARLVAALDESPPPGVRSLHASIVMIMKATRLCNLRCSYCHFWREGPDQVMPFRVLATTIRDVLQTPGVSKVEFTWHGGEVTVLRPAFLRKAIWLQEHFRRADQHVTNTLQTNAVRLDPEWVDTLRRFEVSVGVSLDGPPEIHDRARVTRNGRPTSSLVRSGLLRLREAQIPHGILMVVTDDVVELGAQRLLDHLLELDVHTVGLLNVIPENSALLQGSYLPWTRYVTWLRELFALWWPTYADRLVLRELADLVGKVGGGPSRTCLFAGACHGRYLTVEPQGEISACDKYVSDPDYVLGGSVREAFASDRLLAVRRREAAAVAQVSGCRWFGVCAGGCPHDRRLTTMFDRADDGCCGLAPLLDDIAARTGADLVSTRSATEHPPTSI